MHTVRYETAGGLGITRAIALVDGERLESVVDELDRRPGLVLQSTYSYPGRYREQAVGFVDPPVALRSRGRRFVVEALSDRGVAIVHAIGARLAGNAAIRVTEHSGGHVAGRVVDDERQVPEEYRSKKPTIMTALRTIVDLFRSAEDDVLGLYGAVGYDVVFQFEPICEVAEDASAPDDLVLYLPDRLIRSEGDVTLEYRYEITGGAALALSRRAVPPARARRRFAPIEPDEREHFVEMVREALRAFGRGDLFEVVVSRLFGEPTTTPPSTAFRRLREANPAPYGMLMNLGGGEYLVSASPEMFVRVMGRRVESCPIAGTAQRGEDALDDEREIEGLLASSKDASELVMCADVDRNDKSRICVPGTVEVLAHRQIEVYSRVIHTVTHVEGLLRPDFDALDAFLAHMWAVTVTGAPKIAAISFIAEHERGPRDWYAGAFGKFVFNGDIDTACTLRTIHFAEGVAQVRAGSTLLFASEPEAEADEAGWKAAAMLAVVRAPDSSAAAARARRPSLVRTRSTSRPNVLLLDHEDSFVNTLADYFRQLGTSVTTLRVPRSRPSPLPDLSEADLVCLSPGPGAPPEFRLEGSIAAALAERVPLFGVCLGLQGIVEYFGGRLGVLDTPAHGVDTAIRTSPSRLFDGIAGGFRAGRYHSLYALPDSIPVDLRVVAMSEDGIVMAVEHVSEPVWAVQFHPESIMTKHGEVGRRMLENVVALAGAHRTRRQVSLAETVP